MTAQTVLLAFALGLAVLTAWVGSIALSRMSSALDRLHAAAFLNAGTGVLVVVAGFVTDGMSQRSFKLAAIVLVLLLSGAALSHATGRALLIRSGREA